MGPALPPSPLSGSLGCPQMGESRGSYHQYNDLPPPLPPSFLQNIKCISSHKLKDKDNCVVLFTFKKWHVIALSNVSVYTQLCWCQCQPADCKQGECYRETFCKLSSFRMSIYIFGAPVRVYFCICLNCLLFQTHKKVNLGLRNYSCLLTSLNRIFS